MTTTHMPSPSVSVLEPFALRINKPWGHEIIFTPPELPYTGKILHIQAGKRLSLQYHDLKLETVMLLSGEARLRCDDERGDLVELTMEPGRGYTIQPYQRHRIIAVSPCQIVEASMPEVGTTYRLEDDDGRGNESDADRARQRKPVHEDPLG